MIKVRGVYKSYTKIDKFKSKKVNVLNNVSFEIEKGKITALLGVNGVGKSTIFKIISGLVKPDKGIVLIDEKPINEKIYDKLAFVPDINIHFSKMTIKDHVEFMKVFYKNWNHEKYTEMMSMFKLNENDIIDNLSKGNIARVKIILGFCQDSDYLLLDEPFSGIDIFKREDFIKAITRYMKEDQAIIITTHEIDEIETLVDDVIILDEGSIITKFNAEEVREEEGLSIVEKMREVYKYE